MKLNNLFTTVAIIHLLLLVVACGGQNATSVATATDIPMPLPLPASSVLPVLPTNTTAGVVAPAQPTISNLTSVAPTRTQSSQPVTVTPKPVTTVVASPTSPIANSPRVISFTVAPTTTHTLGEKISMTWEAKGTQATLCPYIIGPEGPVEQRQACSDVPLAGTKTITVDESALDWTGLQLRVTTGQTFDRSLVPIHLGCQGFRDWFFRNPPEICPGATPLKSTAAAQHFERGQMIWVKQPDAFYIFYDGSENPRVFDWLTAPYRFKPGASASNRVGETPPPGSYEPVSGFGQVWRGEMIGTTQPVRQRLGWATDPEFNFNTSYQCEKPNPLFRVWTCYLRSPDGKVLRLHPDSTAQAHFNWEEW